MAVWVDCTSIPNFCKVSTCAYPAESNRVVKQCEAIGSRSIRLTLLILWGFSRLDRGATVANGEPMA